MARAGQPGTVEEPWRPQPSAPVSRDRPPAGPRPVERSARRRRRWSRGRRRRRRPGAVGSSSRSASTSKIAGPLGAGSPLAGRRFIGLGRFVVPLAFCVIGIAMIRDGRSEHRSPGVGSSSSSPSPVCSTCRGPDRSPVPTARFRRRRLDRCDHRPAPAGAGRAGGGALVLLALGSSAPSCSHQVSLRSCVGSAATSPAGAKRGIAALSARSPVGNSTSHARPASARRQRRRPASDGASARRRPGRRSSTTRDPEDGSTTTRSRPRAPAGCRRPTRRRVTPASQAALDLGPGAGPARGSCRRRTCSTRTEPSRSTRSRSRSGAACSSARSPATVWRPASSA